MTWNGVTGDDTGDMPCLQIESWVVRTGQSMLKSLLYQLAVRSSRCDIAPRRVVQYSLEEYTRREGIS